MLREITVLIIIGRSSDSEQSWQAHIETDTDIQPLQIYYIPLCKLRLSTTTQVDSLP